MSDASNQPIAERTERKDAAEASQPEPSTPAAETYVLRLYVAGTLPKSVRAIANLNRICEEHLHGRYDLEVIDLYQQPGLAEGDQILVLPTLIKKLPAPPRRLIGDLSDTNRVLRALDLRPKETDGGP